MYIKQVITKIMVSKKLGKKSQKFQKNTEYKEQKKN